MAHFALFTYKVDALWCYGSLRKQPFNLPPRRWGRFATRLTAESSDKMIDDMIFRYKMFFGALSWVVYVPIINWLYESQSKGLDLFRLSHFISSRTLFFPIQSEMFLSSPTYRYSDHHPAPQLRSMSAFFLGSYIECAFPLGVPCL